MEHHITECIKKANKRLYFIVLLKRANVPPNDIVTFYCTAVRPVLEYCAQVYHYALPQYLSDDVERVQKRVLSLISSSKSAYSECLVRFGLDTLYSRRVSLCNKLFNSIVENPGHKLFPLLPSRISQSTISGALGPLSCPVAILTVLRKHSSLACAPNPRKITFFDTILDYSSTFQFLYS